MKRSIIALAAGGILGLTLAGCNDAATMRASGTRDAGGQANTGRSSTGPGVNDGGNNAGEGAGRTTPSGRTGASP